MGESYLNSRICLISKGDIRYEGILYNLDMEGSSISLSQVRSFGTEGRRVGGPQVPPSSQLFDYIIFKSDEIKDLIVLGPPGTVPDASPAAPSPPAPPPPSEPLQSNSWAASPTAPTAQPYAAPVYGTDQWAPAAAQQPPQPQAAPPPQPAYAASAPPVAPASAQKVAPQVQVAPAAPRAPPAPQQPPPKPSNYAQAAAGRGGAGGRGPAPGPASGGRGVGRAGPHSPYQANGGRGAQAPPGGRGPAHAPAPRSSAPPAAAPAGAPAAASPMPLPVPTEDFNFEEQNAKFKKEEVAKEIAEAVKPRGSYVRDDFFDAISCETLERMNLDSGAGSAPSAAGGSRLDGRGDGRQRAADARRLDMETFGGLGGLRHNYNYGGRGRGRGGRGRGDAGGRGGGRDGGSGGGRGLRPHATGVPNGGGRGGRGRY